jgi:hypothetical protein
LHRRSNHCTTQVLFWCPHGSVYSYIHADWILRDLFTGSVTLNFPDGPHTCKHCSLLKIRGKIFSVPPLTLGIFKGAAPRFSSEDKELLLSEILRSCRN